MIKNPLANMQWVPLDKVTPNDYNPNYVAKSEMKLLYTSIKEDGYTQPVVTFYDEERDLFTIVDGFHRYFTMKSNLDIYKANKGLLPVVVIEKSLSDRIASTVRHNRARGSHSVEGMANLVYKLLGEKWTDKDIIAYVGLEQEELDRLKITTGFAKLYDNIEYGKAWETKKQLKLKKQYNNSLKENNE